MVGGGLQSLTAKVRCFNLLIRRITTVGAKTAMYFLYIGVLTAQVKKTVRSYIATTSKKNRRQSAERACRDT